MFSTPALLTVAGAASGGTAFETQRSVANVMDFGARGDGITDDSSAFRAALATASVVDVPHGSFHIAASLVLRDGQLIRGVGRSGWEPYTGTGLPAAIIRTEVLLSGPLAFDARNTNNAAIAGLSIRAKNATQSMWGNTPGFQPGTTGINIAGALQFDARNVSFHGLEVGVSCIADSGRSAQMPQISDWAAHDCKTVFQFISKGRDFYAARDARINGCIAALHCGRIAEICKCDGLRIENVRFFQCTINSLLIEHTPFVAITGATLFETGEEAIILRDCQYVTMAGMQVARAGYYKNGHLIQRSALLIENCLDVKFEGLVEQSVGRAFTIRDCCNSSIAAVVGTPFWMTGSLGAAEGAIQIERSRSTLINASFGGTSYWIAVWADAASATSVGGQIVTEGPAGVVRCVQLQQPPMGHVARTSVATTVKPNATLVIAALRILIPAGKSLVSRSIELTSAGLDFAVDDLRWKTENEPELGGGVLSVERKQLCRNEATEAQYFAFPVAVHNPSDRTQVVPAGYEIRLSLAFE